MKFRDLLHLSTSNLLKRKLRTALTVMGVTIGVASIVVMVSLGLGLSKSMTDQMATYSDLTSVTVRDNQYYNYGSDSKDDETIHLDDKAIESIRTLNNVIDIFPIISKDCIVKSGNYTSWVTLNGVTDEYFQDKNFPIGNGAYPTENAGQPQIFYGNQVICQMSNEKTQSGYWYDGVMPDIDFMKDPIYIILDTDNYYGGNTTEGQPQVKAKKHMFTTAGIMEGGPEDYRSGSYEAYCNIEDLKTILKKEFKGRVISGQPTTKSGKPYKELYYNQLIVKTDSIDHVLELQQELQAMGYQADSDAEWIQSEQKTMNIIQLVLGGIGAVALLVAAIGIANTMMMSIYERTKEIGIMKVLGCDMRNIQTMFLMEAGFIGFIGGIVGLILSVIISVVINAISGSFMASEMGTTGNISYIPIWLALFSLIFAILVGMAAGFFPSLRAMKLSPLAAIKNE